MKLLVLNPGSASLKFQIIEEGRAEWGRKLVSGVIEPIGQPATFQARDRGGGTLIHQSLPAGDHAAAAKRVLDAMEAGIFASASAGRLAEMGLIVCRVVHGANLFHEPVEVDDDVLSAIESLDDLAPLHNASSVAIIRECRAASKGQPPVAAVFDSAFHRTLPEIAYRYALPYDLAEKYGIRRYGFHGISHKYLMLRYSQLHRVRPEKANIITMHLEGGSSITAIRNGRSIDTSMGFTPLEGLMMATRSGDIDPALIGFLARKENVDVSTVERWLNKESGLAGVSGISPDTRVLVDDPRPRAQLALDLFAYRVRKYIGAYLAAMGGAEAIVFGGGISENTPEVRRRVCEGLGYFGLELDHQVNAKAIDREERITADTSRLHAYVIPTEESLMMARDATQAVFAPTLPSSA